MNAAIYARHADIRFSGSGKRGSGNNFRKLLVEASDDDGFTLLVVSSFDRLSRSPLALAQIVQDLKARGIRVVTANPSDPFASWGRQRRKSSE